MPELLAKDGAVLDLGGLALMSTYFLGRK